MTTDPVVREIEFPGPGGATGETEGRSQIRVRPIRWLKFNFVGAIGIGVQFGALFLFTSVFHLHYLAATALAVEAAVVHNFLWHENFTWVDRVTPDRVTPDRVTPARVAPDPAEGGRTPAGRAAMGTVAVLRSQFRPSLARFARFHLSTGVISLLGNLGLMKMLVGQGHMNYMLANAIAVCICSLANFLVADGWVFDASRDGEQPTRFVPDLPIRTGDKPEGISNRGDRS
jgi:putative flippase GtrA